MATEIFAGDIVTVSHPATLYGDASCVYFEREVVGRVEYTTPDGRIAEVLVGTLAQSVDVDCLTLVRPQPPTGEWRTGVSSL